MSNETTVVHLVRHGEVQNPTGVLYGRLPDFHLSASGRAMADADAAALAGRDIVLVRSSPLERARETAQPIAQKLGLEVELDDRLIEPWNIFEGKTFGVGDGSLRRPEHWKYLRNPFLPSWGEPYTEVAARVMAAADAASDDARGHEAVLVSHQLPIWVTRRAVEGRRLWHRPDRRQCALASITSFVYRAGRVVAVQYIEPAGEAGRQRAHGA
jgi:broad specificity phosphatase PhoE